MELLRTALLPIHKVTINAIFSDGMNGFYLYFVNKHLSSWPLLGIYGRSPIEIEYFDIPTVEQFSLPVESETARVVSLSTTKITVVTRFKKPIFRV